jgi:hypothetical protein
MKHILLPFLLLISYCSSAQSDLMNFEVPATTLSLDSVTGCWQVGAPSKTLFDTAYSATHALMTDTINPYPDDSISYAYFSFQASNSNTGYSLTFKHRYDAESGEDGGYVEVYDWINSIWVNLYNNPGTIVGAYGVNYNINPPSVLLNNGETAYSGNSTGWETTEIILYCALLFENNQNRGGWPEPQFRFVFFSGGNTTNQEGWMIDDIELTDFGGTCNGIEEMNK